MPKKSLEIGVEGPGGTIVLITGLPAYGNVPGAVPAPRMAFASLARFAQPDRAKERPQNNAISKIKRPGDKRHLRAHTCA
jgi:hypothetical protein